jgi:23S rRNA pseudouridine2605 synthase
MRINKFLAHAGVCSRRNADLLVAAGKVAINGVTVQKLGTPVDPKTDQVTVDGKRVSLQSNLTYILLNKPKGYLSTVKDSFQRFTVLHLVGKDKKVYPVGRLDKDTEGVLLLTNDGELAYRLTHPKFEIEKVYRVTVRGKLDPKALESFKTGIKLDDGDIARGEAKILETGAQSSVFELRMREGKKREIKRMCHALGLRVIHLKRIRFAHLTVRGLAPGEWRYLERSEISRLKKLVGLPQGGVG